MPNVTAYYSTNIYTLSACHYICTTTKAILGLLLFYYTNIINYFSVIIIKYIILVNSQGVI